MTAIALWCDDRVMDYAPGYDPSQANYISGTNQAIGALVTLLALGAIGGGVVGVELLGGGAIFETEVDNFARPTIDEANAQIAQGLFNRLQNLPDPQTLEVFVPTTVDEQITVNKFTNYLNSVNNPDYNASFDSSVDDCYTDLE